MKEKARKTGVVMIINDLFVGNRDMKIHGRGAPIFFLRLLT